MYHRTVPITKYYRSVWHQTHYDITDKTILSVLKILTYHITACPIRLTVVPVIMSVATFDQQWFTEDGVSEGIHK
jgi:hypothetical protein